MQRDDETVPTTAGRGLVVVLGDEPVDGVRELDGEGGAVLGGREPDLAVDAERRERLAGRLRARDQIADLADHAARNREQPARGALVGLTRRIWSDRRQRG